MIHKIERNTSLKRTSSDSSGLNSRKIQWYLAYRLYYHLHKMNNAQIFRQIIGGGEHTNGFHKLRIPWWFNIWQHPKVYKIRMILVHIKKILVWHVLKHIENKPIESQLKYMHDSWNYCQTCVTPSWVPYLYYRCFQQPAHICQWWFTLHWLSVGFLVAVCLYMPPNTKSSTHMVISKHSWGSVRPFFRLLLVLLDLSFSSLFISDPTFSHYVLSWQMHLLWSMQYLPLCSKLMSAFTRNYSALSLESRLESWKPMILWFFSALPI